MRITEEQFKILRAGQIITDGNRDYEVIGSIDFKEMPSGCIYGIIIRPVQGGLPSDMNVFWKPDALDGKHIVNKDGTPSVFNSSQAAVK